MGKLIMAFLIASFLSVSVFSQDNGDGKYPVPYNKEKDKIIYEDVVKVPDTDRKTLYDRFQQWGKDQYRNYDGKIKEKKPDAEVPMIEIKSYANLDTDKARERAHYDLKVQFKDNRFRYSLHKLHKPKGYFYGLERWIEPETMAEEKAQKKLKALDNAITPLIESMKDYMKNPPTKEESSW